MTPSQPSGNNKNKKPNATIRNMGMGLSVVGAIIFSIGLVVFNRGSGETPLVIRNILMPAFGIVLFSSGLYIWRNAKEIG